jgi:hypothetical protein
MSVTTTTIALGKWDNRANLDYKPCNNTLDDGNVYDAYGKRIPYGGKTRRPYKIEQLDNGTAYIMYDDDSNGDVPIYKVVEA